MRPPLRFNVTVRPIMALRFNWLHYYSFTTYPIYEYSNVNCNLLRHFGFFDVLTLYMLNYF